MIPRDAAYVAARAMSGARAAGDGDAIPAVEQVAALSMPALVLAWTGDPTHPVATADGLGELLPQAEVVVAEDLRAVLSWPQRVVQFVAAY